MCARCDSSVHSSTWVQCPLPTLRRKDILDDTAVQCPDTCRKSSHLADPDTRSHTNACHGAISLARCDRRVDFCDKPTCPTSNAEEEAVLLWILAALR